MLYKGENFRGGAHKEKFKTAYRDSSLLDGARVQFKAVSLFNDLISALFQALRSIMAGEQPNVSKLRPAGIL